MHSTQLEMNSISNLKIDLMATNYLAPFISESDKEPSWDGFVYVHNNRQYNKKNLGRVAVQVKGKFNKDLTRKKIKYPAEVEDLKNYFRDGGIIYLVVYIKEPREYKIYYAQLEPIKLKEILNEVSETQQTKNIELKKLPDNNLEIVNIFKSFLENRKKQISFVDKDGYTIENITKNFADVHLEFTLTGLGLNESNMQTHINNNNIYLYAKTPDSPFPIPLMGSIINMTFIIEEALEIGIAGEVFYRKQTKELYESIVILKFGESFEFIIDVKKEKYRFNFNISRNIRSLVKDLKFMILLYKNKGFEINGHFFDMDQVLSDDETFNIESQERYLNKCEKIVQVLDYLNIKGDLDCSKLTENEWADLNTLVKGLIEKQDILLRENLNLFTAIKIQDYLIALVLYKKDDQTEVYTIKDLFQIEKSTLFLTNSKQDININVPVFRILNAQQLSNISNVRFDSLLNGYKALKNQEDILSDANTFLLTLILASDLVKKDEAKRKKMLVTSLEFIHWLQKTDNKNKVFMPEVLKLNELQIIKRQRVLTDKEIDELMDISDSTLQETDTRFGAYILLDDKKRAQKMFNKMTIDNQQQIKHYPIYHLFEKM